MGSMSSNNKVMRYALSVYHLCRRGTRFAERAAHGSKGSKTAKANKKPRCSAGLLH